VTYRTITNQCLLVIVTSSATAEPSLACVSLYNTSTRVTKLTHLKTINATQG